MSAPIPMTIHTPRQPIEFTEVKREKGRNRPHAGAADEVNEGEYPAADRFRRIFAGIGESERLFAAETQPTDKPAHHQPEYGWRERAEDCENSEQEQIELVDGLASPPVAEFALTGGANEHAEYRRAADKPGFRSGGKFGLNHVRDQRPEHNQVDDVKEVPRRNQCDHLDVERRNFRVV